MPDSSMEIIILMDAVLLDLEEAKGPKCDERKLRKLPPWRAHMMAVIANRCGALPQERVKAIFEEAVLVGGEGTLEPEP